MKKHLDKFITPHKYDYDWVVSIEITTGGEKIYIFNVYLPYDKKDNEEEYLDRLTKLHNLVAECVSTCITVVGDYNANIQKDAVVFYLCFKHIVRNHKAVAWITNHATLLHSAMMMPPRQMLGIQHSIACAADAVAILGHYIPPFLQGIQITFNSQFQCSISSNLKSVVFKVQFQNSDLKFSFKLQI